jgi:hypothetical protein
MKMITSAAKLFSQRKTFRALLSTKLSIVNISRPEHPTKNAMTLLSPKSTIPVTSAPSKIQISVYFEDFISNSKCDRSRCVREENVFFIFSSFFHQLQIKLSRLPMHRMASKVFEMSCIFPPHDK